MPGGGGMNGGMNGGIMPGGGMGGGTGGGGTDVFGTPAKNLNGFVRTEIKKILYDN